MKRIIYFSGVVAVIALTGCAHDQDGRGGTYDSYEQGSGYERGHPPHYNKSPYNDGTYYNGGYNDGSANDGRYYDGTYNDGRYHNDGRMSTPR